MNVDDLEAKAAKLVSAYAGWLEALEAALVERYGHGNQSKISRQLLNTLNKGVSVRDSNYLDPEKFANTVRQWLNRHSLPPVEPPSIGLALEGLVSQHVSQAPEKNFESYTFQQVVSELRAIRDGNQKAGRAVRNANQKLHEDEVISIPVSKPDQIELRLLRLGSWLFKGEVPPYVQREIDSKVISAFNSDSGEISILVGPPKSGKTRSLIEGLKASNFASRNVYWVSPGVGCIDAIIDSLSEKNREQNLFVLDDLQKFDFNAISGLTHKKIKTLSSLGKVVGTLHDSVLNVWKDLNQNNQGISEVLIENQRDAPSLQFNLQTFLPSNRLLEIIDEGAIYVSTGLNKEEQLEALRLLELDDDLTTQVSNLASFLASVDLIEARARRMLTGDSVDVATLRAILDANLIHPLGATIEEIEYLAKLNLRTTNNNIPWLDSNWIRALNYAVAGVNRESPHAILMRSIDDQDKFSIMDALWERIRPQIWETSHLESLGMDEKLTFGIQAHENGYSAAAKTILSQLVDLGHSDATMFLGYINDLENNFDEAERLYKIASEDGDSAASFNLGLMYSNQEKLELSEEFYLRAIEQGESDALLNLGTVYKKQGEMERAKDLYLQAIAAGDLAAFSNLGNLAYDDNLQDASAWYEKAAESGDVSVLPLLGFVHKDLGNLDKAEHWFLSAAEAGDSDSYYMLARIAEQRGDSRATESWYKKSSESGDPVGMYALAEILESQGLFEDSRHWYLKSAEAGDSDAMYRAAFICQEIGDSKGEKEWLSKSAAAENRVGMYFLANFYESSEDFEMAEFWYLKSAEAGDSDAMVEMAKICASRNDSIAEEEWCLKAAEAGNGEAMFGLAEIFGLRGDVEEKVRWYEKSASAGFYKAAHNLGCYHEDLGDLEAAEKYYLQGSKLDCGRSMLSLAEIYKLRGDISEYEQWTLKAKEKLDDYVVINHFGDSAVEDGNLKEAAKFYQVGAELGFLSSIQKLGETYIALDKKSLAKKWLEIAAENGVADATSQLAILTERNETGKRSKNYSDSPLNSAELPKVKRSSTQSKTKKI